MDASDLRLGFQRSYAESKVVSVPFCLVEMGK